MHENGGDEVQPEYKAYRWYRNDEEEKLAEQLNEALEKSPNHEAGGSVIYHALNPDIQEFRVVVLLPAADASSTIKCQLQHTNFQDLPAYEALSYVWGHPEFSENILLNEKPFYVTPSLETALRHLRHAATSRTLWVDALCINQEDEAERSQQVRYMRDIYSNCTIDIFWLGPHSDDIIRGMEVTRLLQGSDITTLQAQGWQKQSWREDGEDHWTLTDEDWIALRNLYRSAPIWGRVWVVQEISCSPRVVLVCGKREMEWDLVESILSSNTYYTDAFHTPFSHSYDTLASSTFANAQIVQNQRSIFRAMRHSGNISTLHDVLGRFRMTTATDPRDKIYGLLGLVSDSETSGIAVDYRSSAAEVFTNVTACLINTSANLDIISQSFWPLGPEACQRRAGLPSWVPDYAATDTGTFLFAQRGIFCAGDEHCSTPVVISPPGTLNIAAIALGTVPRIKGRSFKAIENDANPDERSDFSLHIARLVQDWARAHLTPAQLAGEEPYAATNEPAFRALWRTLVVDCKALPTARLSASDLEVAGALFAPVLTDPEAVDNRTWSKFKWSKFEFHRQLQRVTTHWGGLWRFVVLERGFFALVPGVARKGDEVAVVRGSKVPILLRKAEGREGFIVLGGCYVHGFMNGEARKWVDDRRMEERVIEIV